MEEVIKMIIDIEDKAQKIVNDAITEKELKETQNKDRIKALENSIINDAKHKVEQIREREFLEIKEQEQVKVVNCENHLKKMELEAEEQMDTWVEELVKRTLS